MAGYFGAALGGALEGYNQALANQPIQASRILALRGELQRQALVNKQLADQQDAARAYLGYYGGQAQPSPQPPVPGQPSVPASPAAGGTASASGPQPVGPMGIAPYESMSSIIGRLRQGNPNMSPEALMSAAGQINKESATSNAAQLKYATFLTGLQEKQATLDMRQQDLEFRMRDAQQRHEDTTAYRDALIDLRKQGLENQREMTRMRREMWGFGGDGTSIPLKDQGKTGDEYLKTLAPADAAQVKALDEGRLPVSVYSLRSPGMRVLVERTMQYDPNFDATTYQVRQSVRRDFTSGPTARNITALNTAIGHLGTVFDLGKALQSGDVRAANKAMQSVATAFGDPRINNFNIARDAVANELTRVFRQVGMSEQETQQWASTIQAANSPQQLTGAVQTVVNLLHSRIDALNDQWNRGMSTDKGFPGIVSKKSQSVLDRVSSGPSASSSPSTLPLKNAKGWQLMTDSKGNQAYVSPDGKQFEEVK